MKIEAIKAVLPTKKLTNDDILALIEKYSPISSQIEKNKALRKIRFLLSYSGANIRNWLNLDEKPIDLISSAFEQALAEAKCDKNEIDLIIYTGVGRGFLEPSGAYHVAGSLGLKKAECFDILDACMSWSRALSLVYALFRTGQYNRALIVNAEFNLSSGNAIFPSVFRLPSVEAIQWSFPAYTLGEAATATIVSCDPEREWEFHFKSRPDLADLCNIPLFGYKGYCKPSDRIGLNGIQKFTSFGADLHRLGFEEIINVFKCLKAPVEKIRAIFPHASSKKDWDNFGEALSIKDLIWHIYPTCGNVVSASVPVGITSAIDAGKIKRGDRIVGWVGSAGMSFAAYSFIY